MEFKIEELRKEGRPLWMANAGSLEDFSELLGGGGDIYTDRLAIGDWDRKQGGDLQYSPEDVSPEDVEEILVGSHDCHN